MRAAKVASDFGGILDGDFRRDTVLEAFDATGMLFAGDTGQPEK